MDNNECVSIENAHALRTAVADGDVALYDVEHTLQQRMDEELSKPAHEVNGDLVERLETMLQIPYAARMNGQERIQPRSFEDIMNAITDVE